MDKSLMFFISQWIISLVQKDVSFNVLKKIYVLTPTDNLFQSEICVNDMRWSLKISVSCLNRDPKIFDMLGSSCLKFIKVYDNDFTSIIDIYFYETFSTPNPKYKALALHSLDTLSDVWIKVFTLLF